MTETSLEKQIAVLEERIEGMKNALVLQASKYEDRLIALNNETEHARQTQNTYVTNSEYAAKHQLLEVKIESLQKFMYLITGGLILLEAGLRVLK